MPKGIPNLGNTCFLNAIIQCLRVCDPWMSWIEQHYSTLHNSCRNIIDVMFDPMKREYLEALVTQIRKDMGQGQIDPTHAFECILSNCMKAIQSEDNTYQHSIEKLFFSSVRYKTVCAHCHTSSNKIEKTSFLLLKGNFWDNCQQCFQHAYDPKENIVVLDDSNKYDCMRCSKERLGKQQAFQTQTIINLSEIVVFVVQNKVHGMNPTMDVVFDNNTLTCVAGIIHSGYDGMGHCTAVVRTSTGWWLCSDLNICELSDSEIKEYSPYIFFMVKQA